MACKVAQRPVSADSMTVNTEDSMTPGSWWDTLVEEAVALVKLAEEAAVALVELVEGRTAACSS